MINQSGKTDSFIEEQIEKKYSLELFEKVISAVHCSFNSSTTNEEKQNALKYLEDLKENHSMICLAIAFDLLKQTNQQAILYHYSLHLIESILKSKWNLLKNEERNLIKKQLLFVIKNSYLNQMFLDIAHIRNSLAKCLIELIKRDCFEKTNTALDEIIVTIQQMTQIQDTNSSQLELILLVFRYLNEDLTVYSHSMQAQRRRQIFNQLQKRLNDILPCLIRFSNDLLALPTRHERLTETSLLTVNSFLQWVEYNHFEQYEYFLCELFLKFFQLNSIKIRHASFECLLSLVNKRLARKQLQQQQQQRNKRIASSVPFSSQPEKLFLNYVLSDQTLEMFLRLLINPTDSLEQLRSIVTNDHINCLKMFGQFLLKLSNYILQLYQQLTTKILDDNEFLIYINERTNAFLQYLLLLNQHGFHLLSLNSYQSLNLFLVRQPTLLANEEFCLKLIFNVKQSLHRIHFPSNNTILPIENSNDPLFTKQFYHNQQCFIYALFEYDSEEQFFWKFFSQYRSELQKLIKSFMTLFFSETNSDRIPLNMLSLKSILEKLFIYLESLVQRTPNRSNETDIVSLSSTYLIIEWEACYLLLDHVLFVVCKALFPTTIKPQQEQCRNLLLTPNLIEHFLRTTKFLLQFTPNLSEHIHGHVLNLLSCLFFIAKHEQQLAIDIIQRLLTAFQSYQQHLVVGTNPNECEVVRTQSSHAFLYLCKNFPSDIIEFYSHLFPFLCQLYQTEFELTKHSFSVTVDEQTSPTLKLLDAMQIIFYQKAYRSNQIDSQRYDDFVEFVKPIYEILKISLNVETLTDFIEYFDLCSKRTQSMDIIRHRRRNLMLALHCLCLLLRNSKQEQAFDANLQTKICIGLRTILFEHIIKVTQFCNQLFDKQINPFYDLLKANLTYSDTERQLYLGTYESNNMSKATIGSTIAPSSLPVSYIRFQTNSNAIIDDQRLRDYLHRLFDISYQINGMFFAHDHQLYSLKIDTDNYFLTTYLQKILFENFNTLPSFRLRIVLRQFCRLFVENYSSNDSFELNELFLSFLNLFLPYIQERLNIMWKNLQAISTNDSHLREDQCSDEVIDECICVLITRDFNDIIRYFIYKNLSGPTNALKKKAKNITERSLSENMCEENNGDFEQIDDCDEQSITNNRLTNAQEYSDLFLYMVKMARQDSPLSLTLFSSLIKILFECLTFPDAYCLNRFLPIILPVTKLYTDILDKHINPSVLIDLKYLFQCLLKSLERHNENEGVNTNLISLIGHIYELWFQRYSQQIDVVFHECVPQLNTDLLNTYKTRLTNNQTNNKKQQVTERERRDTVRNLLNSILLFPMSNQKKDGTNPFSG